MHDESESDEGENVTELSQLTLWPVANRVKRGHSAWAMILFTFCDKNILQHAVLILAVLRTIY